MRFEDDDGAGFELIGDGGEVGEQECCLLLGPPFGASTEQDDGRSVDVAVREERREFGVGGDEDAAFGGGAFEDLFVGCCLEAVVADVYGVVAGGRELLGQAWRERVRR